MSLPDIVTQAKRQLEVSLWGNTQRENIISIDKNKLNEVLATLARKAEAEGFERGKANHKNKVLT